MSEKLKVFVCIPCLCLGGSEIATLQMVQALAGTYAVTVVCYYEHDARMIRRYEAAGAKVLLLDETRNGLRGLRRLLRRLTALFRRERPDVVHGVYFAPGMIPLLAARMAGVRRVFATVHAAGGRGYGWKAKLMFRISAMLTTHFFCVAENTERFWFEKVGGGRHSTIHNGIDIDAFAKVAPAIIPGLAPEDTVIGIVGRVVALKGHDCLFRAVKKLVPQIPRLKVLAVGDGSDRPGFEVLAKELGIAERVIWTGRVEPEELPGYYKRMDILAMPSHWEGFGLTAAEAMAAGVPVVGSDVPGLREVIGDAGLLFPVNDDDALRRSVQTILKGSSAWSARAVDRAKLFALDTQQAKWREAYARLA